MKNQIIIEKYNSNWTLEFENEKNKLFAELDHQTTQIEHIGSTSVKDLYAKPIIDIMIGICDFKHANSFVPLIKKLGYEYIQKYEEAMPERKFFVKQKNDRRTHHIHLVELDSKFWHRHLNFRNYLRINAKEREKYQQLKIELSQKKWNDRDEYTQAKSAFIKKIENKFNHKYQSLCKTT